MPLDKFEKSEKRVALANRRSEARNAYHSPSIEEIATRAHARTLGSSYKPQKEQRVWVMKDYLHLFHGAALVAALVWAYFLYH